MYSTHRPTAAHVNLDILADNFRSLKIFIGDDIKYMAVVKANAYGHGAAKCSLRLESEGVDWFGVAIPEEGVELRAAGVTSPILCLGSFWAGQENIMIENDLTAVIFDEIAAAALNHLAAERGLTLDIHVKIDTGMGRVGIRPADSNIFAEKLKQFTNLRVSGLLTHFASAEDPQKPSFTNLQIERFESVYDVFRNAGHTPDIIDLANSPGAINFPASRGNLVRLGGSLFGLIDDILPANVIRPELRPVLSLHSQIAKVKQIPLGEGLGYGGTYVTERDSLIALVPIGYADGYPRGLSNRGQAIVNDKLVPIVGIISMDWILLDVTDVPDVNDNDKVILIGGEIKALDLARQIGTIGYEITCGLSARVPRIYQ